MPPITRELVNRYIESASPFVQSKTDRLAIQLANNLNSPRTKHKRAKNTKRKFVAEMHFAADKAADTVQSLRDSIWKEIHTALCTQSRKYRKHVEVVRDNANLLIGAIAVSIAGTLGVAVAVVAALVAALLRIVFTMGIAVFCRRFATGIL
jgi:hypothetical protein